MVEVSKCLLASKMHLQFTWTDIHQDVNLAWSKTVLQHNVMSVFEYNWTFVLFVDGHFEASSLHFGQRHLVFLEPEVTIFVTEEGAELAANISAS